MKRAAKSKGPLQRVVKRRHEAFSRLSQEFHNERALFIASRKDLHAIGFSAADVPGSRGFKVQIREYFARVKVFLDLVFNTQPRFYGNRIEIE